MDQLHPTEQFPITYLLNDPNDTGTYYVRAVIYDDVAGTTIDTVNLTSLGSGRFKKIWDVCSDGSGQGRYISIVVKVYTDSGYTTVADNYAQQENKYLVQERWNRGNLGGGVAFSYKKIEEIVDKALGKIPKTEIPKPKSFQPIEDAISNLGDEIRKLPVPEKVNLSPILDKLDGLGTAIRAIKIPQPEKTDLAPVIDRINNRVVTEMLEKMSHIPNLPELLRLVTDDIDNINSKIDDLKKTIEGAQIVVLGSKEKPNEETLIT